MITQKVVDVLFNTKSNPAGANGVVSALQKIEIQADRTQRAMQSMGRAGTTMMAAGASILAPMILAVKKYKDTMGETEPTSARLVALSERWEASQVRIGRVIATEVLPSLEKAMDIVEKIVAWSEENPGAIGNWLEIGTALVVLGGIVKVVSATIGTLAGIVKAVSFIGGLFGGSTAAATGGAATATAATGGVTMAGITALLMNPAMWLVAATAFLLVGIRPLMNWLMGTNQTWKDIATTAQRILILAGIGFETVVTSLVDLFTTLDTQVSEYIGNLITSQVETAGLILSTVGRFVSNIIQSLYNMGRNIISGIGQFITNLASSIGQWFIDLGNKILEGIQDIIDWVTSIIPGMATGGMVGGGIVRVGEKGREFILSHNTTRAAEKMIGGTLTQQRFLQALSGRAGGTQVHQNMRFSGDISLSDKRQIQRMAKEAAISGIATALGGI